MRATLRAGPRYDAVTTLDPDLVDEGLEERPVHRHDRGVSAFAERVQDHVHATADVCTDAQFSASEVLVGRDEDPILLCAPVGDLRLARLVP